jgi:hypothetical protein
LIDTLVKGTIKLSNTHRSPNAHILPALNPNYISIATSGGKSSHRQTSNLLPIQLKMNVPVTHRNKISGEGLSKTADTYSTAEVFVPRVLNSDVSENISMAE